MTELASSEDIIAAIKSGNMVILTDHKDRENEGDLIVAAEFADAHVINFMATHGRGLICLAMTSKRTDKLKLEPIVSNNRTRHGTPFMTPIEAREGITTGISAYDRAHTISVAIDDNSQSNALISPGHIFPLRAKDGGVLVRAGHTEAAVDLARLAGLKEAGVICEIMKDDGTMARLPDLLEFAQHHHLLVGTIADLIAYRRRYDSLIMQTAAQDINIPEFGQWHMSIFQDNSSGGEHIALIKGDIPIDDSCLVRMHRMNILTDNFIFGHPNNQLYKALKKINAHGCGVLVLLSDMNTNILSQSLNQKNKYKKSTFRGYGIGAQILCTLGVRDMILLTSSSPSSSMRLIALDGYDLNIKSTITL